MTDANDQPTLARDEDGEIEAPERWTAYEGDAVIKTPFSTRRPTTVAGDSFPFPLGASVCTESSVLARRHHDLDVDELEVYYQEDGDRVRYTVAEPSVAPEPDAGEEAATGGVSDD